MTENWKHLQMYEKMIASRSVSNPRWLLVQCICRKAATFIKREIESYQPVSYILIGKVVRAICVLLYTTLYYSLAYLTDTEDEDKMIKSIEMNAVLFYYHLWNCPSALLSSKMPIWLKKAIWGLCVRAGLKVQDTDWKGFLEWTTCPSMQNLSVFSYLQIWFWISLNCSGKYAQWEAKRKQAFNKCQYHLILPHFLAQLHPLTSLISFYVSRFTKPARQT